MAAAFFGFTVAPLTGSGIGVQPGHVASRIVMRNTESASSSPSALLEVHSPL